ncbi:YceK/YidQ family lipoprotein [Pantoea rodasii]|uniref:YceK/YidQ family lipoprotein n=1 Tax=Pantoea rodasii TaxID=1076549 RepID=A0A2M9WE55_9GAMM|nr:YceK/YidQ family lipoprotein [Pantoea rodasii]ORM63398.1 hypothetical protein HA45_14285 [Pantoea rodasii]PJZ05748.1 YceK/YidQ family lipoprotein [Pantoea rodasii]
MKMMKSFPLTGLLVCGVLTTSGCSSVMSHTGASQGYYPGTRASADLIADDNTSWVIKPLAVIDLPFSAVMDTVLLPWDYFRSDHDSARERVLQSEKMSGTDASLATAAAMPATSH